MSFFTSANSHVDGLGIAFAEEDHVLVVQLDHARKLARLQPEGLVFQKRLAAVAADGRHLAFAGPGCRARSNISPPVRQKSRPTALGVRPPRLPGPGGGCSRQSPGSGPAARNSPRNPSSDRRRSPRSCPRPVFSGPPRARRPRGSKTSADTPCCLHAAARKPFTSGDPSGSGLAVCAAARAISASISACETVMLFCLQASSSIRWPIRPCSTSVPWRSMHSSSSWRR